MSVKGTKIWKWFGQETIIWVYRFDSLSLKKVFSAVFIQIYSSGVDGKLFTGILFDHYVAPQGFCFDEKTHLGCHDDSINGIIQYYNAIFFYYFFKFYSFLFGQLKNRTLLEEYGLKLIVLKPLLTILRLFF